jgi:hypothetical protein
MHWFVGSFFGVFLAKNGIQNLGENHQKITKKPQCETP